MIDYVREIERERDRLGDRANLTSRTGLVTIVLILQRNLAQGVYRKMHYRFDRRNFLEYFEDDLIWFWYKILNYSILIRGRVLVLHRYFMLVIFVERYQGQSCQEQESKAGIEFIDSKKLICTAFVKLHNKQTELRNYVCEHSLHLIKHQQFMFPLISHKRTSLLSLPYPYLTYIMHAFGCTLSAI